jgi:transposase
MRKIKDVLRLKLDAKLSHEQIAGALGISKGVVTKYVGLAAAAGLDWPTVQDADEITLERRLLVAPQKPRNHVQPDYGRLHQELRRKGMTLMLLWEEYRAEHADRQTYAYSQFCDNYRRFARQLKRSMRQIHRAGEKLFIDYAGPTIALTDGSRAHIFVAAMGASSYTFAFATPRETMADWLESTARALSFYGGVTQLIVPDNPRALISDANRYEPRSNDTVLDFARHYGTSILPARPYHPQDKAYASYCTLCGWWNSDKGRLCRTVAAALPFDQDDVADGLVEATMQVTVAMLTQHSALAPQVDASRADSELCGELVGCHHAACAKTFKPALEPVGGADDENLLVRERFTFPVCITERIKLFGDLPIRAGFEEFVDLRNDFRQRLANQCDGLGLIDLQRSCSAAAKAYMDRNAFGLDQGYVFNEQSDHALALDRHDSLVIPNAGEVFGERLNLGSRIAA